MLARIPACSRVNISVVLDTLNYIRESDDDTSGEGKAAEPVDKGIQCKERRGEEKGRASGCWREEKEGQGFDYTH